MAEYEKERNDTPSREVSEDMTERMAGIRKRYKSSVDAERDLRDAAIEDFRFAWIQGNQWDTYFSGKRGKNRPKYEFNKLGAAIKQVVNDNRQNTPSIKVRATKEATKDLAEIRQGLIRNIESQSNADEVYDWGSLYAITSGFGAWTVNTKYVNDDSFDQDIVIERVADPLNSVWFDPSARDPSRKDARWCFVESRIPVSEFRERWPSAQVADIKSPNTPEDCRDWFGEKDVRIAEYWFKSDKKKTIYQLSDGRVVDAEVFDPLKDQAEAQQLTIVNQRDVTVQQVKMEVISGVEVLEPAVDWAGRYIPVVPVYGNLVNMDGKDEYYGMVRMAKDAQRLYNYNRSTMIEILASQARAPFLYTPKHVEGFEAQWRNMAVDNAPGLPYNPDPLSPGGMPQRQPPPAFPAAMQAAAQVDSDDIKAVTGIYDASLGQRSNETSGRAIQARAREGDTATYDYADNIGRAIQYTGMIIDDLIPHIIDTQREIRILGEDGSDKYLEVNKPVQMMDGSWGMINDLSEGQYDISVTVGPSYATQRMETLDAMLQLVQMGGPTQALAMYGAIKNMDVPGLSEIEKSLRKLLVNQNLLEPEEGDTPPQPPQPNPKDVASAQRDMSTAQLNQAKTQEILANIQPNMDKTQSETIHNNAKAMMDTQYVHHKEQENEFQQALAGFRDAALGFVQPAPGGNPGIQ